MPPNFKKDFGKTRERKPDITSLVYGKVPPQAPELEEAVLGAMMLERDKVDEIFAIIPHPECFYMDAHQKIYDAITRLYKAGFPIDLMTVTEFLRKENNLEIVGGAHYLTRLTMAVISSANATTHAMMIMEKFFAREVIRTCGAAISAAYEDSSDVFELLETTERSIANITTENISSGIAHISKSIPTLLGEKEEQRKNHSDVNGVNTGYRLLNLYTRGWQKTDLIILAARPAVGKTAFALNLANNAQVPTVIFSLEMSREQLIDRQTSINTGIDHELLKRPSRMNDVSFSNYLTSMETVYNLPIYIDDTASISSLQLRAKAKNIKKQKDIQLIIIDYLQLMSGDEKSQNREQEISKISRDLKRLAKDMRVPVIALCQLNRAVESRSDGTPRLADLRESGAIEQDADMVAFLYEDLQDKKYNTDKEKLITLLVSKNRHGDVGSIKFSFNKPKQKFSEYNENDAPITTSDLVF